MRPIAAAVLERAGVSFVAGAKTHTERIWFQGAKMVVSDVLGPKISFKRLK